MNIPFKFIINSLINFYLYFILYYTKENLIISNLLLLIKFYIYKKTFICLKTLFNFNKKNENFL